MNATEIVDGILGSIVADVGNLLEESGKDAEFFRDQATALATELLALKRANDAEDPAKIAEHTANIDHLAAQVEMRGATIAVRMSHESAKALKKAVGAAIGLAMRAL